MGKEVKKKDNKKDKKEEKATKTNSTTMRSELKKVTWPTRKELVNSTGAVIIIVIITAVIVFCLDLAFRNLSTHGINKLRSVVSNKVNQNVTIEQEEVVTDNTTNNETTENEVVDNNVENTGDTTDTTPAE